MTGTPRIALFADTFYEVNGAARTCREWDRFASRRGLPFLCIHWGQRAAFDENGPVWSVELVRSRWSLAIDPDLQFDLCFLRLLHEIEALVRRFRPDFIHITSLEIWAFWVRRLQPGLARRWQPRGTQTSMNTRRAGSSVRFAGCPAGSEAVWPAW